MTDFVRKLTLLIITFLLASNLQAKAKKKVVMQLSRFDGDVFYSMLAKYAQAAADDLDIELKVIWGQDNHIKIIKTFQDILSKGEADAIIFENFKNNGKKILQIAEKYKVPAINIIYGFEEKQNVGKPRGKYKSWVAQVLPDERGSGEMIAELLFRQAKPSKDGKVHVLGIGGEQSTSASKLRILGLKDAVAKHKNVVLHQVTNAPGWKFSHAKRKFKDIKGNRFPQVTVAWMASDLMALGAIEGAREMKLKPGKDVLFAGVDWIDDAYKAIMKGDLVGSAGGANLMSGAWSIVLLHDYLHGEKFDDTNPDFLLPYELVDKKTVKNHIDKFNIKRSHELDFSIYSRKLHPNLKSYNFSISSLKSQIGDSKVMDKRK